MKKIYFIIPFLLLCVAMRAQVSPTTNNSTGGSATLSNGGYLAWSVGEPIIGKVSGSSATVTQGVLQTWPEAVKNLMLTLYLEGLFNGGSMAKAQNASGDEFMGDVADKITVELHNAGAYSTIVYSVSDIALSTTGQANVTIPGRNYGSYYVTVKHRNSLETTTAVPVSFSNGTIEYSFDVPSKAFGNNLKGVNESYCIYAGDVNGDGLINAADINSLHSAASIFSIGYITDDVNGDGIVDAMDLILTDNNAANFIAVKKP
jgi:hypothetical protein